MGYPYDPLGPSVSPRLAYVFVHTTLPLMRLPLLLATCIALPFGFAAGTAAAQASRPACGEPDAGRTGVSKSFGDLQVCLLGLRVPAREGIGPREWAATAETLMFETRRPGDLG